MKTQCLGDYYPQFLILSTPLGSGQTLLLANAAMNYKREISIYRVSHIILDRQSV